MQKLTVVGIKQIEIINDGSGGAVILAVSPGKVQIEIHLTLEAFAALEVMLAAGAVQQSKSQNIH